MVRVTEDRWWQGGAALSDRGPFAPLPGTSGFCRTLVTGLHAGASWRCSGPCRMALTCHPRRSWGPRSVPAPLSPAPRCSASQGGPHTAQELLVAVHADKHLGVVAPDLPGEHGAWPCITCLRLLQLLWVVPPLSLSRRLTVAMAVLAHPSCPFRIASASEGGPLLI